MRQYGYRYVLGALLLGALIAVEADSSALAAPPRFPVLTSPPTVKAGEANENLRKSERVIGVVIEGEARAYPISMINQPPFEIVNDVVGGEPITVTWCDICQNAAVYSRQVGGQQLTFMLNGTMFKDNMVMRDGETGSLWSQLLGRGLEGRHRGAQLTAVPAVIVTWETWYRQYPESTVLMMPRMFGIPAGTPRQDNSWYVIGLPNEERPYAWPFNELERRPVLNTAVDGRPLLVLFDPATQAVMLYERQLDGHILSFTFDEEGELSDAQTGSRWNMITGTATAGPLAGKQLNRVAGMVAYRHAWTKFYPQTDFWQVDKES